MKNKAFVGIVIICGVLMAGFHFLSLIFNESLYVKKNTIQYYIVIPSVIRELPTIDCSSPANYYYSAESGNKPLISSMECSFEKEPELIMGTYSDFFEKNGYLEDKVQSGIYIKREHIVKISILKNNMLRVQYIR